MSSNELIDIHVLEETASRVSGLTTSITKQVSLIEEVSLNARKALGPSSRQNRNLDQFKSNATAVLAIYERIEKASLRVAAFEEPISQGPSHLGWEEYVSVLTKAHDLFNELSSSPDLRKFPQLSTAAKQLFQAGTTRLQKYLRQIAKLVFVPVEGDALLGSNDAIPEFAPEDITSLAKLVNALDQVPELPQDFTDEALVSASNNFLEKSLSPAISKLSKSNYSKEDYRTLSDGVKGVLINGLQLLFGGNPQKFHKFQAVVNSSLASLAEKSNRAGGRTQIFPQQNKYGDAKTGPAPVAVSSEALQGPSFNLPNSSNSQPYQGPRSEPSGKTLAPLNTADAVAKAPADSRPSANIMSPSTPISSGTTNNVANWAVFERIERSRSEPLPTEELEQLKREGVGILAQVFVDIEAQCRKAPITSEFGVSGASLHFMKTLQNINSAGHGLEIVLSELATRQYLAKPLAPWAAKSDPSPAARADPVSLYNTDAILCQYHFLHQVSSDQLKDKSKTGIFMLSNLSAVEHFITNSNTDNVATAKVKSELMSNMGEITLQKFQQLMEQSFKEYLADWSKLAPHLMESTVTGAANAKLTSKDRDVVKEKFRVFNAEFEALVERQKKFQVSDPVLRAKMSQEVKKLIAPLYMRFYQKHKDGDFTKNIAKYVKYTPAQLEEAITF